MYTCYIQSFKILASFCSWAAWFESNLVENPRRHVFSRCCSYVLSYTFITIRCDWIVVHVKLNNNSFSLFIFRLNIDLRRHKCQTWNGYFILTNENVSSFWIAWRWTWSNERIVKNAFVLSGNIKFSILRLHIKFTSSAVLQKGHIKKNIGWGFDCRSFSNISAWFGFLHTMHLIM